MIKFLFAFLIASAGVFAASPDPKVIIAAYRQAHDKQDLRGLMALVEFSPATPKDIYDSREVYFRSELSFVVTRVEVMPLDDEDRKTLASLRKDFDSTLEPEAKLVRYFDEDRQSGPAKIGKVESFLGVKNGVYRIVTAKNRPNQAPEPTPTTVTPPAGQESRQP